MNQEKRFSKNIEIIEDLSKDSILRRLDVNCLVFIKKWIKEERKDAQEELLLSINKQFDNHKMPIIYISDIKEYLNELNKIIKK